MAFFNTYEGLISFIIASALAFSLFLISPESTVPTWIAILLALGIVVVIWGFLIWKSKLPKREPVFSYEIISIENRSILFSTNLIAFFPVDSYFTLYIKKNKIEFKLGIGRVIHIQDKNIVHATIIYSESKESPTSELIRISPTISIDDITYFLSKEEIYN